MAGVDDVRDEGAVRLRERRLRGGEGGGAARRRLRLAVGLDDLRGGGRARDAAHAEDLADVLCCSDAQQRELLRPLSHSRALGPWRFKKSGPTQHGKSVQKRPQSDARRPR